MAPNQNFPLGFQRETLATMNRLLPLSYSIFALVDPSIRSKGMVLQDIDIETDWQYQTRFYRNDPLHPDHFRDSGEKVVCLDDLLTEEELFQSIYYREFMRPHQMRYVADMFLRGEGEIIAVLSLIRNNVITSYSIHYTKLYDPIPWPPWICSIWSALELSESSSFLPGPLYPSSPDRYFLSKNQKHLPLFFYAALESA